MIRDFCDTRIISDKSLKNLKEILPFFEKNFSYRQSHKVKNNLLLKKDGHSSNIQAIIKNLDIVPTKRKLGIEAIQEAYQFDCTFFDTVEAYGHRDIEESKNKSFSANWRKK